MASPVAISFDLNKGFDSVVGYLKEAWSAIARHRQTKEHLQHLLIASLGMHPCLAYMRPVNADWVTGIGKIGRNPLYKRLKDLLGFAPTYGKVFGPTEALGGIGTRARIMLLLCWLIGHRISSEKRISLISTAVEAGLKNMRDIAVRKQMEEEEQYIMDLLSKLMLLRPQFDLITELYGTSAPVNEAGFTPLWAFPSDQEDIGEAIHKPSRILWAKDLPESQLKRLAVDIAPHVLLDHIESTDAASTLILMPETKLDESLITLCVTCFGLGNKATKQAEVKYGADIFWNADPPPASLYITDPSGAADPLHLFTRAEIEINLCMLACRDPPDIQGPCHLTCDPHCTVPCTRMDRSWVHDALVRQLLTNQYCEQEGFLKSTMVAEPSAHEVDLCQLSIPSASHMEEAAHIACLMRSRVGDAAETIGLFLSTILADRFNESALVAFTWTFQWGPSVTGACIMAELHSAFQESLDTNPAYGSPRWITGKHLSDLFLPFREEIARLPDRLPQSLNFCEDCTCGACNQAVRQIEDDIISGGYSVENDGPEVAFAGQKLCGAATQYLRGRLVQSSDFYKALLNGVSLLGSSIPKFTPSYILSNAAIHGLTDSASFINLGAEQRAQILFCSLSSVSPKRLTQQKPPSGSDRIGYLWNDWFITYGPWLPQYGRDPDDVRCFVQKPKSPNFTYSLPYTPSEPFADTVHDPHEVYISLHTSVYMGRMFPMTPDPPPQATGESKSLMAFDTPPDVDVRIHLDCAPDGRTSLTAALGDACFTTSIAPSIHRGRPCDCDEPDRSTARPVLTFAEFISLPDLPLREVFIVACSLDDSLHEDAAGLVAVFVAPFHKRVYLRDRKECIECAWPRMRHFKCSVLCA